MLFDEENWKNYRMISKKLIISQNYIEFDGCHGNVKNDGHTTNISKFRQRMKEQLLKVSAISANRLFKTLKKPYRRGTSIPLVRPRVNK